MLEESDDGVSLPVQKAFASMLGEVAEEGEADGKEVEQNESLSAGDVFALEMELNRENKKMMRVRMAQKLSTY